MELSDRKSLRVGYTSSALSKTCTPDFAQSRHGVHEQVAKHSTNVQRPVTFSWHGQADENEPSEAICNYLLKNVWGDNRQASFW